MILSGCALALMPDKGGGIPLSRRDLLQGIALGLTGAIGQGVGAVLTRRGYEANALEGLDLSAMTSCFQRMTGSLIVTGIIIICIRLVPVSTPVLYPQHAASYRKATPWIVANALSGLVIGVSLLQWALKYYPTGIVLAIVATTPILLMPLTYLIEGDKPSVRATIGAVIAVVGVIVLNIL